MRGLMEILKDLARRTASNKVLRDEAFNIAKNPKYDGYQYCLLLWFINFLIKSLKVVGVTTLANKSALNYEIKQNEQLAKELHKPIIRKF